MKNYDGLELVGYIKERQAKQVRALRQSWRVIPRLAIVSSGSESVSELSKQQINDYAKDIMVEVDLYDLVDSEIIKQIEALNHDENVHGIILQISSNNLISDDKYLNAIIPEKDVDGIGNKLFFSPAIETATNWILAAYNIDTFKVTDSADLISKSSGFDSLTISALFENVIYSARKQANQKGQQDL